MAITILTQIQVGPAAERPMPGIGQPPILYVSADTGELALWEVNRWRIIGQ